MKAPHFVSISFSVCLLAACNEQKTQNSEEAINPTYQVMDTPTLLLTPETEALLQASEKANMSPPTLLVDSLTVKNWASELLVGDPIAIDIDGHGRVYFTRTQRQKNSEFDIRSHREWEFDSVQLETVEEKRVFLRTILASEKSADNLWLRDLNNDGTRDWRDLRVEKEQVYRLEDRDNDGIADSSLLVVEDFNDETTDVAGALLVDGNRLYLGVAPDMWRLSDSNNDGVMDQKLSMANGFGVHIGFSGHGMSGAEMGPDGRIYWGIGDIGFNGKGNDDNGHSLNFADRGVIARCNSDGSDFEVFAMGVRNTHEFAFDDYGNLISVDNDGDHPGESERIVYLTEGSDSGWRINWQLGKYRDPRNNTYKVWMDEGMYKPWFAGQPEYITPPIANYVNGPTGMVYNPGTALSEKWKNTFFVTEFVGDPSQSGIHAFRLAPAGAGFRLQQTEKILGGILATGMEFGPDGALYIADWIDGWRTNDAGRIWKLDDTESNLAAVRAEVAKLLPQDFEHVDAQILAKYLEHADVRVRQKAQFSLVNNKSEAEDIFLTTLSDSTAQLARIHAIWGLSQLARKNTNVALQLIPFLKDNDPEIRAQTARWLGDLRFAAAANALMPLLQDEYPRARFFAAEALGRTAHAEAAPAIISMLRTNNGEDRYLHHAGSLALARIGNIDLLAALAQDESEAVRLAAVVALRRISAPELQVFLHDSSERVIAEAARAINDDDSIPDALAALGNLLNTYKGTSEAIIRRAINANLRLGNASGLQTLLDYIAHEPAPNEMREEAIAALSTWSAPSIFDRVDGKYRGQIQRDGREVSVLAEPLLTLLLQHSNAKFRELSAKALGELKIDNARGALFKALEQDSRSQVRIAALEALANLHKPRLSEVVNQALKDPASSVRAAALNLLNRSELDEGVIASLLDNILDMGALAEKRSALTSLAKLSPTYSHEILVRAIEKLASKQFADELVLELVDGVKQTNDSELMKQLNSALLKYSNSDLERKFPGMLAGGNVSRGKDIFFWHQSAHCMKCHTIQEDEEKAGPNLENIGTTLSKEQILQALVEPSARIAPGYGSGPSSMPNMSYFLTSAEIRDLVSYLSSLSSSD